MMSTDNGLPMPQNGRSPSNTLSNGHREQIFPVANGQLGEEQLSAERLAVIWQRRAAELATPPQVEPDGATLDLLVFSLGGERYGIKVSHVREIYPPRQITPVPRTPKFVVGVFSARGRLLSIIDLHAFLGVAKTNLTHESKIIVVTGDEKTYNSNNQFELGLVADEVEDVLTIFEDDMTPPVSGQMDGQAEYTLGITADLLIVLNLKALLQNRRLIVHEEI